MISGDLDRLALRPTDALVLDFDGTLAELGPDPDLIHIPETTAADLKQLTLRLGGAVAVLSGRDLRDLAARTPATVWRLGAHGLEVLAPGGALPRPPPPPPEALLARLTGVAAQSGVRVELKGPVVAIHYRAAPEAGAACLVAAEAAAQMALGYVVQAGKMVIEVKPVHANKGAAVAALWTLAPFAGRRPVMLGDDATDEDAMRAALDLGGLAIKVGPGDSLAPIRAPSPAAVRAWLARESSTLQCVMS